EVGGHAHGVVDLERRRAAAAQRLGGKPQRHVHVAHAVTLSAARSIVSTRWPQRSSTVGRSASAATIVRSIEGWWIDTSGGCPSSPCTGWKASIARPAAVT